MSTNLILGLMDNYSFHRVKKFVYSLQKIKFDGDVCLFVGPGTTPRTIRSLRQSGIRLEFFDGLGSLPVDNITVKTYPLLSPINFCSYRHYLYHDYLLKHKGEYKHILLTDVRDVLFQSDPFGFRIGDSLYCALENLTIRKCGYNCEWMKYIYGEQGIELLGDKYISCAGTTWGKDEVLLDYLSTMLSELQKVKDGMIAADQAIHNYMIYTGMLGPVEFLSNDGGVVLTLSYDPDYTIDDNNVVRVKDNVVVKVLHQFDRRPDIVAATDKWFRVPRPLNGIIDQCSTAELRFYKLCTKLKRALAK